MSTLTEAMDDYYLEEEAAWIAQQSNPLLAVCLSGQDGASFEEEKCLNCWGGFAVYEDNWFHDDPEYCV